MAKKNQNKCELVAKLINEGKIRWNIKNTKEFFKKPFSNKTTKELKGINFSNDDFQTFHEILFYNTADYLVVTEDGIVKLNMSLNGFLEIIELLKDETTSRMEKYKIVENFEKKLTKMLKEYQVVHGYFSKDLKIACNNLIGDLQMEEIQKYFK